MATPQTIAGRVVGRDDVGPSAPGEPKKVVYQWSEGSGRIPHRDDLTHRVNSIYKTFVSEYDKHGDTVQARAACRGTNVGRQFEKDYYRFFKMITDPLNVTFPHRMPLVHQMIVVTYEMHNGLINKDECRQRVLGIAQKDQELRATGATGATGARPLSNTN